MLETASTKTIKSTKQAIGFRTFDKVQERIGHVSLDRIFTYPAAGTATVADLLDGKIVGDRCVELVDGILVEKIMGYRESLIASTLITSLNVFLKDWPLGAVAGEGGMIRFKLNLVRLPDVSFIRWDSVDDPEEIVNPPGAFLEFPPDLAVEVLSPSNTRKEMAVKLDEYAKAGVKLVWYVDPEREEVAVYTRPWFITPKMYYLNDIIDGGKVLPGYQIIVKDIFAKPRLPPPKKKKKK